MEGAASKYTIRLPWVTTLKHHLSSSRFYWASESSNQYHQHHNHNQFHRHHHHVKIMYHHSVMAHHSSDWSRSIISSSDMFHPYYSVRAIYPMKSSFKNSNSCSECASMSGCWLLSMTKYVIQLKLYEEVWQLWKNSSLPWTKIPTLSFQIQHLARVCLLRDS